MSISGPLTQADNGSTVHVSSKSPSFRIQLKGNPSTGYIWAWTAHEGAVEENVARDTLTLATADFTVRRQYTPLQLMVGGGGGAYVFKVKASEKLLRTGGEHALHFAYARPWETNGTPAETFTINVHVD